MNLLLIHGAWHSSWIWDLCLPQLKTFCHPIRIDLPGRIPSKDRSYLELNLNAYVQAVIHKINALQEPCYLLGHSMSGMVISQVAEKIPNKIKGLIYLSAFIPSHGECIFDMTSTFESPGISPELNFLPKKNQVTIQQSLTTLDLFYGQCESAIARHALSLISTEPLKPFATPVTLSANHFGIVKKYVIHARKDKAIPLVEQQKMTKKITPTQVFELESDHSPFLSQTTSLCNIIRDIIYTQSD